MKRGARRQPHDRVRNVHKIYLVIVGAGAACALAVSIALLGTPSTAGTQAKTVSITRTATCEEGAPGARTIQWTARYRSPLSWGHPLQIQLLLAGREPPTGASDVNSPPWTLWWVGSDGVVKQVSSSVAQLSTIRAGAATANLLSPDHECSLVLSGSPVKPSVAVIGDSVFAGIQNRLTTVLQSEVYARSWLITAESGFGWGASAPLWPTSTIRGSWAIGLARGLDSQDPSALVVELGANDSLRATFADVLKKPELASQIRAAVAANISELLAQSARVGVPTVLVNVPTFPTTLYGGGMRYQREAQLVDSIISSAAAGARGDRVTVADWATLSAPHHLPQSATGNWFTPDGLHPNQAGDEALVGLVRSATDQISRGSAPDA